MSIHDVLFGAALAAMLLPIGIWIEGRVWSRIRTQLRAIDYKRMDRIRESIAKTSSIDHATVCKILDIMDFEDDRDCSNCMYEGSASPCCDCDQKTFAQWDQK